MPEVTLAEAKHTMHTNGKRRDKRQKKPLPYELQVHAPAKSTKGKHTTTFHPAAGMAATWWLLNLTPPKGKKKARWHVRIKRGKGSYVYRRYDDINVAQACVMWLRRNQWSAQVVDSQPVKK